MSLTYILSLALRLCTPVLLISIGGMFVLKANIFNLALEGFALMGAFAAVAGAHFSGSAHGAHQKRPHRRDRRVRLQGRAPVVL